MFPIEEILITIRADVPSNEDLPARWWRYLKPIAIILLAIVIIGWISYIILYR